MIGSCGIEAGHSPKPKVTGSPPVGDNDLHRFSVRVRELCPKKNPGQLELSGVHRKPSWLARDSGGLHMPHAPKPFFKLKRNAWYVEVDRIQHFLGKHPIELPPPKKCAGRWQPPRAGRGPACGGTVCADHSCNHLSSRARPHRYRKVN
jgi:hypothetical protein